ncbi:ribonuclease H-like domain-containing protein [Tanacetum coccineum]
MVQLNYFLGVSVTRNTSGIFLSQQKYATEVLERAGLQGLFQYFDLYPALTSLMPLQQCGGDVSGCCQLPVARDCVVAQSLRELLYTTLSFTRTIVYCDNVSAVYLSSNPVQHQRTKHIEIDIHFVRDLVTTGHIRVLHVPSRYQYADIFTKGLPTALFDEFRDSLSVRSSPVQTFRTCKGNFFYVEDKIVPEEYPELLYNENKLDKKSFKDPFPRNMRSTLMYPHLSKYIVDVKTFPEPILYMASLQSTWRDHIEVVLKVVPYKEIRAFKEVVKLKEHVDLAKIPSYLTTTEREFNDFGNKFSNVAFPFLIEETSDPSTSLKGLLSNKSKCVKPLYSPRQKPHFVKAMSAASK